MLASLWPWLAVAAAGVLHGLNPLTGWAVAAWRVTPGTPTPGRRVVLPIALGQGAAVLVVAAGVPMSLRWGVAFPAWAPQALAGGMLLALAVRSLRAGHRRHATRGGAALGLWSFIVGMGHGAGWMLVPALASVCLEGTPGREITVSGSLLLGAAALGVHLVAMLATTAVLVAGVRRMLPGRPTKAPSLGKMAA